MALCFIPYTAYHMPYILPSIGRNSTLRYLNAAIRWRQRHAQLCSSQGGLDAFGVGRGKGVAHQSKYMKRAYRDRTFCSVSTTIAMDKNAKQQQHSSGRTLQIQQDQHAGGNTFNSVNSRTLEHSCALPCCSWYTTAVACDSMISKTGGVLPLALWERMQAQTFSDVIPETGVCNSTGRVQGVDEMVWPVAVRSAEFER